ncbi:MULTISPECIES: GNAT family N-acetyltransferase [unclassified Mesorhizobium]|uniref:GNAT family N-acetyltransferase n=1 Tax=unclassified Mesorhizobium TaxID=325217 RepID=UPI00333D6CA8
MAQQRLKALVARLAQVTGDFTIQKQCKTAVADAEILASLDEVMFCSSGCGGWSRRATLYGGDRSPGRDAALLDPTKDAARVRAMYTHPSFIRRGVGRLILMLCEDAARREGFTSVELMATRAGEPLYRACGFVAVEEVVDNRGGAGVPLLRMRKAL